MYGYIGKILHIDLTTSQIFIEEPSEEFYRRYMGGPGIGLYYLLKDLHSKVDPLGPENTLVFATGLLTGTGVPCVPRFTVLARSPLTGGLGKSEAGGWWGPELKRAGFDAVVIKGKAEKPVYLWINDGEAELKDASHLWGLDTGELQDAIRGELNDIKIQIAQIGPAGENLVLYAGICNNLAHFNGRNGLGAVMGSKLLRAIAVRGKQTIESKDKAPVTELLRWVSENVDKHPLSSVLHQHGTAAGVTGMNAAGLLPTNNWDTGVFPVAAAIGADEMNEKYLKKRGGCHACPVRCKRVVEINEVDLKVESKYGGPEYETLVALGSNCGIGNLKLLIKLNELCNKYALDPISLGMTISFAMKCYEEGIINKSNTDGLELTFGNEAAVLELFFKIVKREGIGNILADGSKQAAAKFGKNSSQFLIEVKGNEVPMHDPRAKSGVGLQYALAPNGADHWFAQHDPFFSTKESYGTQTLSGIGLGEPVDILDLGFKKVRLVLYTSYLNGVYDMLGVCVFGYAVRSLTPLEKLLEVTQAVTGWECTWWELMKAGDRYLTMAKEFNYRMGLTIKDDKLPRKFFTPFVGGPQDGKPGLSEESFEQAVKSFYEMAGWNNENGRPVPSKFYELNLDWLI